MKKFNLLLTETIGYNLEIEANTEEEARKKFEDWKYGASDEDYSPLSDDSYDNGYELQDIQEITNED